MYSETSVELVAMFGGPEVALGRGRTELLGFSVRFESREAPFFSSLEKIKYSPERCAPGLWSCIILAQCARPSDATKDQ